MKALLTACGLVAAIAMPAPGAESPTSGPAPSTEPTGYTVLERHMVGRLNELEKTAEPDDVLELTRAQELEHSTFAFRRTVLHAQSVSQRRLGMYTAAERSLRSLVGYTKDEPAFRRREEMPGLIFLVRVYECVVNGYYRSPRVADSPSTGPAERKPVSDDGAWEAAKKDYARYLMETVDGMLAALEEFGHPEKLMDHFEDMLDLVNMVRPHFRPMADGKAVVVIGGTVKRYETVMTPACKDQMEKAELLRKRKLWPPNRLVTPKEKRAIAYDIHGNVKSLYLMNYQWGKSIAIYSRRHDLLDETTDELKTLAKRGETLLATYVELDKYMDVAYDRHPHGAPPNDPHSEVPTEAW